jgi:hypothetical protein
MKLLLLGLLVSFQSLADTDPGKEAIRSSILQHKLEIMKCHQKNLPDNPEDVNGKLVLIFEVDETGTVKNTTVDASNTTLKNPKLQKCLIQKSRGWAFPPAPAGQTVMVSYPFVF